MDKARGVKKQNSRVVLGIDPGTGRCGWALLAREIARESRLQTVKTTLLDCGLIETPANTPLAERLETIFCEITDLAKKHRPAEMAVEELFFVKNVKTGISVAHARGAVMLAARLAGVAVYEYKPNEIKLAIAGHGHATKEQVAKMLQYHLKGCKISQDDTADAIAVALVHLQKNKKLTA